MCLHLLHFDFLFYYLLKSELINDLKKFSQNIKFTKYLFYMAVDFLKERLQCDRLLKQFKVLSSTIIIDFVIAIDYNVILYYKNISIQEKFSLKVLSSSINNRRELTLVSSKTINFLFSLQFFKNNTNKHCIQKQQYNIYLLFLSIYYYYFLYIIVKNDLQRNMSTS